MNDYFFSLLLFRGPRWKQLGGKEEPETMYNFFVSDILEKSTSFISIHTCMQSSFPPGEVFKTPLALGDRVNKVNYLLFFEDFISSSDTPVKSLNL